MIESQIPDFNIFMMCPQLNETAVTELNSKYYFRNCRPDEIELWKAFPFDSNKVPDRYRSFMDEYVDVTYGSNIDAFFRQTIFVCDLSDIPVATCSYWKAYGRINSIQWFKTLKAYEGRGIGRALLSVIMKNLNPTDYPVYLHTQPGSYRAIKLYSDFGFKLLRGGKLGTRTNELGLSLPLLENILPKHEFLKIGIVDTPFSLIENLKNETTIQF